jgi:hypothetical protein
MLDYGFRRHALNESNTTLKTEPLAIEEPAKIKDLSKKLKNM